MVHLPEIYGQFLDEEHKQLLQSVFEKFREIYRFTYDENLDHDLTLSLRDAKVVVHDLKALKRLLNDKEFLQSIPQGSLVDFLGDLLHNLNRIDNFIGLLKYKTLRRKDPNLSKLADEIKREKNAVLLMARKLPIK